MRDFLTVLLQCSLSMSLITLAYVAVLPLLAKRYAANWRYMVWLVIALGWIVPFRPRLDLPFLAVAAGHIPVMPAQILPSGGNMLPSPITAAGNVVSAPVAISLWWVLAAIWILGVFGITVYHVLRHRRFMKMVSRWQEPVSDWHILQTLNDLKSELGVKTQIGLSVCQSITGPMLIGFFRPTMLLPPGKIADEELSLILKHELIHLQRHDLCCKACILAATILHWFNPVVYLMAKAAAVQCEISCDALVLDGADLEQRKQYGETIIGVARNGAKLRTVLSTDFYGGKKGMKNRISAIMDTSKKKAGIVILGVVLVAIIGTGVALAASNKEPAGFASDKQEVVALVQDFGKTLKTVSLTAPGDMAAKNIEEHYAEYVTPQLLALWKSDPQSAPGRRLSSPWPDRIEIADITSAGKGEYTVSGEIIEVTSAELQNGGAAAKYPLTLRVTEQDKWRISDVTITAASDTEKDAADSNLVTNDKRSGTATVTFYDDKMNAVAQEANWYQLTSKVTLRVKIDGDIPDLVSVYITPTGTETADQRQQLAVVAVTDDSKTVDIKLDFSSLKFSQGHLQVALEYGNTALFSDLYNVYYGK